MLESLQQVAEEVMRRTGFVHVPLVNPAGCICGKSADLGIQGAAAGSEAA